MQVSQCPPCPCPSWGQLPLDVIGVLIGKMHTSSLEALSEINAHWRAAVKVQPHRLVRKRAQRNPVCACMAQDSTSCVRPMVPEVRLALLVATCQLTCQIMRRRMSDACC